MSDSTATVKQPWFDSIKTSIKAILKTEQGVIRCGRYFKAIQYLTWINNQNFEPKQLGEHIDHLEDFVNGKMNFKWEKGVPVITFPYITDERKNRHDV